MAEKFDVVIIGGAVTGSILALALSSFSQHKMQIAIVEKSVLNVAQQGGFDARSIALAEGSLQKLRQIQPLAGGNLGSQIAKIATPIQQIHISDQGHFGKTSLNATELKQPQFGAVVELAKLGEKLTACIHQHPNIRLFCPSEVANLARSQTACTLTLSTGERLQSALMVAADGIQSQLAERCGVSTQTLRDYAQSALIANVEISEPHQHQAFERFTTQGPLALLPMHGKQMSLVWCLKEPTILQNLCEDDFLNELQQQFGWKLGKFKRVGKRFVYLLKSQKAHSHIHHRLAIVGNAAQLLHPVAGQGFNLGMRDLFQLATLLGEAFQQGNDLGEWQLLQKFDRLRERDQIEMMSLTSGLISIFSCEFLPMQVLRNAGLIALSHLPFARAFVANKAMGLK